jgi:hypothetical protein
VDKVNRRRIRLRVLLVGAAMTAVGLLGAGPAMAQQDEGPDLAIKSDELTTHLVNGAGTVRPVLANNGAAKANITVRATLDRDADRCEVTPTPETFSMAPNGARAQQINLAARGDCVGQGGTLIFSMPDGPAATVRFSLTAEFAEGQAWIPVAVGGGVAVIFVVFCFCAVSAPMKDPVHVGASWSFSDNWVTNISTVGGVLATVLAAGGFLESVIPGVDTDRLVGLSLLFSAVIVLAPVLYSICTVWGWEAVEGDPTGAKKTLVSQGTVRGVVAAAFVTIFGVVGQLATLWMVNDIAEGSGGVKAFIYVSLGLTALAVFVYAVRFAGGVTKKKDAETTIVVSMKRSGTL